MPCYFASGQSTSPSPEPADFSETTDIGPRTPQDDTVSSTVSAIDAHIHQWNPFITPRVTSGPAKVIRRAPYLGPALVKVFPKAKREFIGDPQYLLNPYLPADYLVDGQPAHVETIIHVEAGWHGKGPMGPVGETEWLSSLPFGQDGAPTLGAIVAYADPSTPQFADLLDAHLRANPLVHGIRCMGAHSDDPGVMNWAPKAHWLTQPDFLCGFSAVAERGLSFDMWVYAHQLPDASILAREYPDTMFILDHYASPVGLLGPRGKHTGSSESARREILRRWRDDISALAELPNVVAKHSGIGMPVLGAGPQSREQLRDSVAPLITHLDQEFGPDRTFWSSNFPIDKPNVSLVNSIWILREVLGDRFAAERMLRDNARRVYRVPS